MTGKPMSEKQSERKRMQLDFSPEAYARLVELRRASKADSNSDVLRNAIRLYEWFLDQKAHDYKFQLTKGEEVREVEFLF